MSVGDGPRTGESDRNVEALTRVATLMGLALPAAGAVSRYVSFGLDGRIPPELAVADSLPGLAVTGFERLLPAGVALLFGFFLIRFGQRDEIHPRPTPRWVAQLNRVTVVLCAIAVVLGLISSPMSVFLGVGPLVAGVWLGSLASSGRTSFSDVLPVAVVLFATSAVTAGISPPAARAAYLSFGPSVTAVANGWFDVLGQSDGQVYVRPCLPNADVTSVREELVTTRQLADAPGDPVNRVGILDLLQGHAMPRLGFVSGCSRVVP